MDRFELVERSGETNDVRLLPLVRNVCNCARKLNIARNIKLGRRRRRLDP